MAETDGHQIPTLLGLLTKHAADVQVCSQVCSSLELLTFTDVEHRAKAVRERGVETLLDVLARHQDADSDLLRPAVDALWNLTFDDEALDHAAEGQGIERIAVVMSKHEHAAQLLGSACAVLLNLAVREQNRWKIVQSGLAAAVASAMQRHPQCEEVLEQGCQALYMLAYHQDLRPMVLAANGADAAALAALCSGGAGRAQKWGKWLQEVLAC